jgi:hypothetical protein
MRRTTITSLVLVFMLIFPFNLSVAAAFSDIADNWARSSVTQLAGEGLFAEMWEGEFHPHQPLMRSEALELLARAFHVSEKDIASLDSWLTDAFPSDLEEITRGEFAAALGSVLGLGQRTSFPAGFYPSFGDVEPGYPGALAAELLKMLEVLPHHMHGRFESYRLVTRSEAAFMLDEATQFERITGEVAGIDGEEGRLLTDERPIQLTAETIFLTADGFEGDELGVGEAIEALVKDEKALLVTLGRDHTAQVLLQGLNNLTEVLADVLTPAQLSAILEGDWDQLNEEVQYQVYEELMARGLAPWEADALLKQDWGALQLMAQERITQEAANYFEVPPELVHAALTRNWGKVLEYVQIELTERLLASDWLKLQPKN